MSAIEQALRPVSARWRAGVAIVALALVAACDPCFGVSSCGDPHIDVSGRLIRNNAAGSPFAGVLVSFRRTGGVELESDSVAVQTDSTGAFALRIGARAEGEVRGRLTFVPPEPFTRYAYATEVEIATVRVAGERRLLGQWSVGPVFVRPRINHVGELYHRGSGEPAGGVAVEFRQTGGPALSRPRFGVVSGSDGRFYLRMDLASAGASGEVVGELIVTPPAPAAPFRVENVRMATVRVEDDLRYLSRWGVGGQLRYQGELVWEDTYRPAADVEVEFRRTGGIAVEPTTFVVRTGTDGRFHLSPKTREDGEVIADLHVRAPNPANSFVIRGVRLATREDDESRLLGVWTVR